MRHPFLNLPMWMALAAALALGSACTRVYRETVEVYVNGELVETRTTEVIDRPGQPKTLQTGKCHPDGKPWLRSDPSVKMHYVPPQPVLEHGRERGRP